MRVVFIGCVQFSETTLEVLLQQERAEIAGIVTKAASAINADFRSLEPIAAREKIPCFLYQRSADVEPMIRWIQELAPDVVYCFGWSHLLPAELLSVPRLGVIGYHPAALPQNRGRHPIIWALALGLKHTASTFFFMDEGADTGDILDQRPIAIEDDDDAATLYSKLENVAKEQIASFTRALAEGTYMRVPQDHTKANSWRKRGKQDGAIDWRMSSASVHNLVRALTRPYIGAHLTASNGEEAKVWKTVRVDELYPETNNLEPGKVLRVNGTAVDIKCGHGVIRIVEHEMTQLPLEGTYI
ncbi:formyltransferase family protein [Paenibacillus sp.]|uniref:formyltransferase family protein n=1 Tax=Paenibacillus sp. TaxID=58172 RepID=UPI002D5908F6|nr:formyltransferase family protein [Paenibacillus sp.]HZG87399.1 formyltransferase family protein [Paenibacillus sp.]